MKTLFYVESTKGCGIRAGTDMKEVAKQERRAVGALAFKLIRPATESDVAWVRAMGGRVPKGELLNISE